MHVYRLVTRGTVEERIIQRAEKKLYLDQMVNRGSTANAEALEKLGGALARNMDDPPTRWPFITSDCGTVRSLRIKWP